MQASQSEIEILAINNILRVSGLSKNLMYWDSSKLGYIINSLGTAVQDACCVSGHSPAPFPSSLLSSLIPTATRHIYFPNCFLDGPPRLQTHRPPDTEHESLCQLIYEWHVFATTTIIKTRLSLPTLLINHYLDGPQRFIKAIEDFCHC